jgi:hypothetical protein
MRLEGWKEMDFGAPSYSKSETGLYSRIAEEHSEKIKPRVKLDSVTKTGRPKKVYVTNNICYFTIRYLYKVECNKSQAITALIEE